MNDEIQTLFQADQADWQVDRLLPPDLMEKDRERRGTMDVLGCPVTDDLLAQWARHIVSPVAPFFLAEVDRPLVPIGAILFERAEIAADHSDLPLEARDAYALYRIVPEATWATLLTDTLLDDLAPAARRALLRAQWRLGRGQIYDHATARDLCGSSVSARAALGAWTFDTDEGEKVALQHRTWWTFPEDVRRRWLCWFVAQRRDACVAGSLTEGQWATIDSRYRAVVRHLAGRFPLRSGPNCFSTTLAALAPDSVRADAIARLWLHQAPFLRALETQGFRKISPIECAAEYPPGTVLLWQDGAGMAQHACFVPGPGWALNKDDQGWFVPRQLVPLQHVVESWRDDYLTILPYQSNGSSG